MLRKWPSSAYVFRVEQGAYVMRRYREPVDPCWPQRVLDLLYGEVWRPVPERAWRDGFLTRFGFVPPGWLEQSPVATHGDPTMSNVLVDSWGLPVWIDPKPVGRGIPARRGVDIGKVLQSLAGWERLRGMSDVVWEWPTEWHGPLVDGAWWLGVHCRRIKQRSVEGRSDWEWADEIQGRVEGLLADYGMASC